MQTRKLAILLAVPPEMAPLARRLGLRAGALPKLNGLPAALGRCGEWELLAATGGVGVQKAERAAERLVEAWKPDLLLMTGVAGALSPSLALGDVVVAESILTGEERLAPPVVPVISGVQAPLHTGPLLSRDRVLVSADEKRKAADAYGASPPLAVEMETMGLAGVARARGIPWAAIRAVSDTSSESLPLDFNALRSADGDLPTSRVALAALRQPGSIPGLIRLGRNTSLAADALSEAVQRWIESGCPTR